MRYRVPVLEDGVRVLRDCEEFDTSEGAHAHWPDRFFARIVDAHLARTENAGGRVGDAQSYLIDARPLLAFALEVMIAVAATAARRTRCSASFATALFGGCSTRSGTSGKPQEAATFLAGYFRNSANSRDSTRLITRHVTTGK